MAEKNLMLEKVMEISRDMGAVKTTMIYHTNELKDIKDSIEVIKSSNNGNYLRYIQSKEELDKRIVPLEEDYKKRCTESDENRKGFKEIFFSGASVATKIIVSAVVIYLLIRLGFKEAQSLKL